MPGTAFGANVASISFERQVFEFRYPFGPQEVVALFRRYFGPIIRAFEALDDKGQAELHDELVQLWDRHNQAAGGTTHTEAEILEIVAVPA